MWSNLWRHLLPGTCLLCEVPVPPADDLDLCVHCADALPWNLPACLRCGLPLKAAPAAGICTECAARPPPYTMTVAPLRFESDPASWVRRLKDRMGMVEGRVLGTLLARAAARRYRAGGHEPPDLLVPVPLHWRRLIRRGHNQAVSLGVPVAHALGRPLRRTGILRLPGPGQRGRGRAARLHHPAAAFRCRRPWPQPAPRIGIVDDVMTTGATAAALAQALLDAGAREVHVLAATRTVRATRR